MAKKKELTVVVDKVRLVKINTTAFEEEDFALVTDLTDKQIKKVITPMVEEEREDDSEVFYSNEDYAGALKKAYPENLIIHYEDGGDDLEF